MVGLISLLITLALIGFIIKVLKELFDSKGSGGYSS